MDQTNNPTAGALPLEDVEPWEHHPLGGARRGPTMHMAIDSATNMRVSLPARDDAEFTVRIGWLADVSIYMERGELEKLHTLIGRALDRDAERRPIR